MQQSDVLAFIKQHKLGVIATISAQHTPQAALVGIAVTEKLEIIFDTLESTRKFQNLKRDPRAAIVIGLEDEITVQLEGIAEHLTGDDLARYKEIYFNTYPDGRERQRWPGIAYFIIRPTWLRYSSYEGGKEEIVEIEF